MVALDRLDFNLYNRMHNSSNPYQGDAKRVLCVCSAGLLRSPTAAKVLSETYGYNTRAAGIDAAYALIVVDKVLTYWADEIVCMSLNQVLAIKDLMPADYDIDNIICLDIEDSFGYMDPKLVKLILERYPVS